MSENPLIGIGWRFPLGVSARGGIALADGAAELEQAMLLILRTPKGQRQLRPEFGCQIHDLLFAPVNATTLAAAEHAVREALAWWEPRITVTAVQAAPDEAGRGGMAITVTYLVKTTHDQRALVYPFYTIPGED